MQSMLRCPDVEVLRLAIADLQQTQAAQVTVENGIVTFVSRRLKREWETRESARQRQARCREKKTENGPVTDLSQREVYTGNGIQENAFSENDAPGTGPTIDELFKRFWAVYPRPESLKKARSAFIKARIDEQELVKILEWLAVAMQSEQWQNPSMIPHPATLLNQRRWEAAAPPPPSGGLKIANNQRNTAQSANGIEFDPDKLPGYSKACH